ncbi:hypothetical protein [Marinilabilia sp.]|uniref:hypothetical protein n=1 Tax=Marinilabilia sp. TaxID=2021252 RepID=UPI0025C33019|nr:hypothetical protein [Marinilabilia sp.]
MEKIQRIKRASQQTEELISNWENILMNLTEEQITVNRNSQNRNIKQILGHLVDSSVNNHHRIVRLQYLKRLYFPDYQPDNDTWIHIQNYENADWVNLVQFWKLYGFHLSYIMSQVNEKDLNNLWTDGFIKPVSLEDIIIGFPEHLKLHLNEIHELMKMK